MKIAIVGCGKLGIKVISALANGDHAIAVIDKDESVINKISQSYDVLTIVGNAKSVSFLEENEIGTYDFLLACTDDDEKNLVVASFAKKIGCKKVIARLRDPEHMNQFDFIKQNYDIDFIVNPDLTITNEIYKYLVDKYTLSNGFFSSDKVAMIQFNVTRYDRIIGLNMIEAAKLFPGMLVFAISRSGKVIIPHGSSVVQADDTLFMIGPKQDMQGLYERVYEYGKSNKLQKVMIMGGGKTGFYLAQKLSEAGVSVKIVEINKARCHYLATHLNNVMILEGDATDTSLLEEENLAEMDAFVAATGFDEENLLLSLIAKRNGVEDVISKVSRQSYKDLIESMGIDIALNPLDIETSNIITYIQGNEKIVSSMLIQGQGEIMEIVATHDMKIVNKSLKDLKLPEGMLITAIEHDSEVIIPNGETRISDGDKVTIFYLLSEIEDVDNLFATKKFL